MDGTGQSGGELAARELYAPDLDRARGGSREYERTNVFASIQGGGVDHALGVFARDSIGCRVQPAPANQFADRYDRATLRNGKWRAACKNIQTSTLSHAERVS